jgi:hypothetical protein
VIHSYRYAVAFQLGVPVTDFTGRDWAFKAAPHFVLNNPSAPIVTICCDQDL